MVKLDLGSGRKPREGFEGVDVVRALIAQKLSAQVEQRLGVLVSPREGGCPGCPLRFLGGCTYCPRSELGR